MIPSEKCVEWAKENNLLITGGIFSGCAKDWEALINHAYAEGQKDIQAERDELLAALEEATTSLETIALRSYGAESMLDNMPSVRDYAKSRSICARRAINSVKGR